MATQDAKEIELLILPKKNTYVFGDKNLVCEDGRLRVIYENQKEELVPLVESYLSGYNPEKEGAQAVVISYMGRSTTWEVYVKRAQIQYIKVVEMPQVQYKAGEFFSIEGLEVHAFYVDGNWKDVTAEIAINPSRPLMPTDSLIAISYQGSSTVIPVEVYGEMPTVAMELISAVPRAIDTMDSHDVMQALIQKELTPEEKAHMSALAPLTPVTNTKSSGMELIVVKQKYTRTYPDKYAWIEKPWEVVPYYASTQGLRFGSDDADVRRVIDLS